MDSSGNDKLSPVFYRDIRRFNSFGEARRYLKELKQRISQVLTDQGNMEEHAAVFHVDETGCRGMYLPVEAFTYKFARKDGEFLVIGCWNTLREGYRDVRTWKL